MDVSTASIDNGVSPTVWPESMPNETEHHIASVVCGNSHLHWAFHNGMNEDFAPALFWRTPPLKSTDVHEGICEVLSKHLPGFVHDFVFGEGKKASAEAAIETQQEKQRPKLTVYIISTVVEQTKYINKMWCCIPSRVFLMQADDFFSEEEGRYPGMGVDRLASLRGAADINGFPSIVFDGGTATTCTAANCDGHVLGGTIGPGLQVKLRSLNEFTDALPNIHPSTVLDRLKSALANDTPLSTFARDTQEAIMVDSLLEFALKTRALISQWLKIVGEGKLKSLSNGDALTGDTPLDDPTNSERNVFITGGDGEFLSLLLNNESGNATDCEDLSDSFERSKACKIRHQKHLVHYGIAAAVMKQIKMRMAVPAENTNFLTGEEEAEENETFLGARVAKVFEVEDGTGDKCFRGAVVGIDNNPVTKVKLYKIRYDDNDTESVSFVELNVMIKKFKQLGEKKDVLNSEDCLPNEMRTVDEIAATPSLTQDIITMSSPSGETKNGSTLKRKSPTSDAKSITSDTKSITKKRKLQKEIPKKKPSENLMKQRVAKYFDGDLYFGTIQKYDSKAKLYKVIFDDEDEEEYDRDELDGVLKLYATKHSEDPRPKKRKRGRPSASDDSIGKSSVSSRSIKPDVVDI